MTIRYFKSRKQDAYGDLQLGSIFLQQVSRPLGINTNDVTTSRYPIISHPTKDEHALVVTGAIPIHPGVRQAAQGTGNFPTQEAFINNQGESARIKGLLRNNNEVDGFLLIPRRWDEKTYEQLEIEGFFQELEI
jgi:hypothetical protein